MSFKDFLYSLDFPIETIGDDEYYIKNYIIKYLDVSNKNNKSDLNKLYDNKKKIIIYSNEWRDRNKQVKQFIKAKLGIFKQRIYARNCDVKQLETINRQFLKDNHIQGSCQIKEMWGLFYNDELIGAVTYGWHHRNTDLLVLNRLAFKDDIQCIGGASKLVKYSLLNKEHCITWSDNRWTDGSIYEMIGFKYDDYIQPDYIYVRGDEIKQKQTMQKKKIGCPPDITERVYCEQLGYHRIYDCGKKRWIYNKKIIKPYTYLIGWSFLDKWYYGCKFGVDSNPKNLWKTYFTSSDIVSEFRKNYGEPDVVEVRKVFNDSRKALMWECEVLRRLNVPYNKRWLNQHVGNGHFHNLSYTSRQKMRLLKVNRTYEEIMRSEERAKNKKEKISNTLKKRWKNTPHPNLGKMPINKNKKIEDIIGTEKAIQAKEKMRLSKLGKKRKPHSEETKEKMRLKALEREQKKRGL